MFVTVSSYFCSHILQRDNINFIFFILFYYFINSKQHSAQTFKEGHDRFKF